MKILKIRENKLKLSLSCEEAAEYGLGAHAATPSELRAAVERIFADRRELFRIEERIVVEAYPKMDGSCDVFVTNLPPACQREGTPGGEGTALWGFCSREHLALALYVLLCEREHACGAPLCERDETQHSVCENELTDSGEQRSLSEHFSGESFCVCDLVGCLRAKTNNDRTQKLREALEGCRIYKSERPAEGGGCTYILEMGQGRGKGIGQMCEFASPMLHLGAEVLREHASEISLDEFLAD